MQSEQEHLTVQTSFQPAHGAREMSRQLSHPYEYKEKECHSRVISDRNLPPPPLPGSA